ncbi:MAG: hypothetical protein J6V72_21870 [Kiritimatiellae bacterium]|nr:hypothetical protein [Kiritimatiellia bacterium]
MEKHYDLESAHGAAVELLQYDRANWSPFCYLTPTIEEARRELADSILSRLDDEDRGEEFEAEWRALAERARTADVGDVLAFDERGWRIVEETDEE